MKFRAGDIVRHRPTKQTRWLAVDQDGDTLWLSGGPAAAAKVNAADCALRTRATDREREEMLCAWISEEGDDPRKYLAIDQLRAQGATAQ